MEPSENSQDLLSSRFFWGLTQSQIEKVAPMCQRRVYEAGEAIFQQGDFGEHLYVIAEGQVFLERSADLGGRRGQIVIDTFGKGRILGCWSTLLNEPHIILSSAICQKPTTVLVFSGADLRALMDSDLTLGYVLMERLCFLLRDRVQSAYGALEKI